MLQYDYPIRVRYGETDKMGYLYYGLYAHYFEIGRTEMMRSIGFPYRKMEDEFKVMMPVTSMQMRFVRPARYDDLLTVRTTLKDFPETRAWFHTEIFNAGGKLLNAGDVRLAFVDMTTFRGCRPPDALLECLRPYFGQ